MFLCLHHRTSMCVFCLLSSQQLGMILRNRYETDIDFVIQENEYIFQSFQNVKPLTKMINFYCAPAQPGTM